MARYTAQEIVDMAGCVKKIHADGHESPARPVNRSGLFQRLKEAWLVLRGRADIVEWEDQP